MARGRNGPQGMHILDGEKRDNRKHERAIGAYAWVSRVSLWLRQGQPCVLESPRAPARPTNSVRCSSECLVVQEIFTHAPACRPHRTQRTLPAYLCPLPHGQCRRSQPEDYPRKKYDPFLRRRTGGP